MGNKNSKIDTAKIVTRCFAVRDFRAASAISKKDDDGDSDERELSGHAAVFDSVTSIGGWWNEIIARGAFDTCDFDDVLFFVNHMQNKIPLARSRRNNGNSTMQLSIDDVGLFMNARIDTTNNNEASALYSAINRGDISGMSFCFCVSDDSWTGLDTDTPTRTINAISKVFEVSAVNEPAYDLTDISARDKQALENAKQALENVRSQELENSKRAKEINMLKIKNKILGGI
jgi:HK97 family phage prohead protease